MYKYCISGYGKEYDVYNTIRYDNKAINLCFINKNNILSKIYKKIIT